MKTPLFNVQEYRIFLKDWINSQEQSRGLLSKLATTMNCQNSHLTRVLREEEHLTPDQAFEACGFMKLTAIETTYFLKMVAYERAASPNYKKQLLEELKKIKLDQENLSKRFEVERIGHLEKEMTYYSSWFWSAIHIITEIPNFQTPKAIAERLGLNELFVRNCLQSLENFKLVQRQGETWKISTGSIHLPKGSPMNSIQHGNWRSKAVLDSQAQDSDGIHLTIVQSISNSDFDKIKQILLKGIDDYRSVANESKSEELTCLVFDFFRV